MTPITSTHFLIFASRYQSLSQKVWRRMVGHSLGDLMTDVNYVFVTN